jgi:hypothetical protein
MLTVHVRINDGGTGKPTPVRVRFLGPSGAPFVPFGRFATFPTDPFTDVGGHVELGCERFVYIDGTCEIPLPPGDISIKGFKGPEYSPVIRTVTLGPGQVSLRLTMERWTDLRGEGWYSGDSRAHSLSPHAALLEGAAEDLAVVNLLAVERPPEDNACPTVSNLLAFSGDRSALETPGHLVVVNTLNTHPRLGAVSLLNCHRVVYPLRFGGPDGLDDWSISAWCEQCHRKHGLVVWPDVQRLPTDVELSGVLPALLLGQVDAFEVCRFDSLEPAMLSDWYRLLDCGLRLPLVGGSRKDSNLVSLGSVRTYARLKEGEAFSYSGWIEAVRAGRTFITNGPLLTLMVDGAGPGTILPVPEKGLLVPVRAEVRSMCAFDELEVMFNGRVVASKSASGNRQATLLETGILIKESGWLAARSWGRHPVFGGQAGQYSYAHTSPIYFEKQGQPIKPDRETSAPFLAVLERTLAWAQHQARCTTPQQLEHLVGIFQAAQQELLRRTGP